MVYEVGRVMLGFVRTFLSLGGSQGSKPEGLLDYSRFYFVVVIVMVVVAVEVVEGIEIYEAVFICGVSDDIW